MVTATKSAVRLIALLGLSVLWLVLWCTPALAHAELLESEPEAGAALAQVPEQVRLRFSEPIEAEFDPLEVYDAQGNRADEENARVAPDDARVLVADLKELPEGPYTVEWRVASVDGHVIDGTFDFTVTESDVSELAGDSGEPSDGVEAGGQATNWMLLAGLLGLGVVAVLGLALRRKR